MFAMASVIVEHSSSLHRRPGPHVPGSRWEQQRVANAHKVGKPTRALVAVAIDRATNGALPQPSGGFYEIGSLAAYVVAELGRTRASRRLALVLFAELLNDRTWLAQFETSTHLAWPLQHRLRWPEGVVGRAGQGWVDDGLSIGCRNIKSLRRLADE